MLYDPGFDHETSGPGPLPGFGGWDEVPLPTTDWAQALLDRRGALLSEMALDADDPRPDIPPLTAFDSEFQKERDDFFLFGAGEPDPFEGLPDGGNPGDITVSVRVIPGTAIGIMVGDIPDQNGNGPGSGGGGPLLPPQQDRPCGDPPDGPTPADVEVNDLRRLVQDVARDLVLRNDDWEWGVVVYMLDGQLYATRAVTQENPNGVGFSYTDVTFIPTGAHVVAWVHTHTYERGDPPQFRMSDFDVGARERMVANSNGRYTVDAALMTYVIDNQTDDLLEFNETDDDRDRGVDVTPCGGLE